MSGSAKALSLAGELREAAAALIAVVERLEPEHWCRVPAPGVWSVGKEAEHAAEGLALHLWSVRVTIGQSVMSNRPAVERKQLTTALSPGDAADLLRRRTQEVVRLVERLSDEQLGLPTRPPRAGAPKLAETIERVLIGHLQHHRAAVEAKLAYVIPRSGATRNLDGVEVHRR